MHVTLFVVRQFSLCLLLDTYILFSNKLFKTVPFTHTILNYYYKMCTISAPSGFTKYNLSETESDITVFIREYKERIKKQLESDEDLTPSSFISFAEKGFRVPEATWLEDNTERFFKYTPNQCLVSLNYLREQGCITSMVYSPNGEFIVVGHITGMIQLRHGVTGTVLATLRNIQFPHKPIHSLEFSRTQEKVCYAACTDGTVYRIEIPNIDLTLQDPPEYCIKEDPALVCLTTQFYSSPGVSLSSTPFITHRTPALCLGVTSDDAKLIVGYGDTSIKLYDIATQEAETVYKVHKLRLQFIPKKLQRMHSGQVVALKCHDLHPNLFASGAWDNTLRIWDVRCQLGCMMTFEGVNICHNSIDLRRNYCMSGSWQPTEALSVWDLAAKRRVSVIRVQNRRPDVDGEYIYACHYWRSSQFNRKGKYGIIGGSGTNCVEVINLHNRYITCSYPAPGVVLAIASHEDKIAFGGTAPVFNIVSFHDPKHEKYIQPQDSDWEYTRQTFISDDDTRSIDTTVTPEPNKVQRKSRASRVEVIPT